MGGLSATQQFARYYALPGVGHCGGNGPDTYDGLGAVVAWSEKHIAPQALVATQLCGQGQQSAAAAHNVARKVRHHEVLV